MKPPALTVRAVLASYRRHAQANNRLSPRVREEREQTWSAFEERYGSRLASEMKPADLIEWVDGHEGWKSPWTRRDKAQQIRTPFFWAHRLGRLGCDPFAGVEYEDGESRRPMTWEEMRAVLRLTDAPFRRFLLFLWFTGARQGEAREIVWGEVDLERGVISKERHKTRRHTKRAREIILVPQAVALLQWIRRHPVYIRHTTDDLVFVNSECGAWSRQSVCTKFARLRRRAGLPEDVTPHCARHAFGSELVAKGASVKLVSAALGHASVSITERYYVSLAGRHEEIRAALMRR